MEILKSGADTLFILLGAIMVLAMHAGFAFLELGTVRKKNQVNALVKILVDFAVSTIAYFFIGYSIAYGVNFFSGAELLAEKNGYELVKFFFLLTFAAAIPAIISGGIAERAKFNPQLIATFILVGFVYPFFEGIAWNQHFGIQAWIKGLTGEEFHDFAGSVVAGLVAVCAGSDLMHPLGALLVGLVAGGLFVYMFTLVQNRWKLDDVLGVWPLHGLCGLWGGLAAGIFGTKALGGLGGITFTGQLIGSALGVGIALIGGFVVYGGLKAMMGIRMSQEEEYEGADLSVHRISSTPEREPNW